MIAYAPSVDVVAARVAPEAVLVAATCAEESAVPRASCTTPAMRPLDGWAGERSAAATAIAVTRIQRQRGIGSMGGLLPGGVLVLRVDSQLTEPPRNGCQCRRDGRRRTSVPDRLRASCSFDRSRSVSHAAPLAAPLATPRPRAVVRRDRHAGRRRRRAHRDVRRRRRGAAARAAVPRRAPTRRTEARPPPGRRAGAARGLVVRALPAAA